jgi:hypothetical protein
MPARTIAAPVEQLDVATVVKVSQAVSGEIVLEKLIDILMRTAVEQAGAERGTVNPRARRASTRGSGSHHGRRGGARAGCSTSR